MKREYLERLIRVMRKTGDTVIISDPEGGDPIVLMGLERYEMMLEAFSEEGYSEELEEGSYIQEPAGEVNINQELPVEYQKTKQEKFHQAYEGEYDAPPVLDDVFEIDDVEMESPETQIDQGFKNANWTKKEDMSHLANSVEGISKQVVQEIPLQNEQEEQKEKFDKVQKQENSFSSATKNFGSEERFFLEPIE